ncbi:hypothetical protein J3S90_09395 [Flavobacterium sp. P4023]|uniref:DUF3127 domain-containing protein n=1 Tax=Flavobacterium flabelliforme TaxID=2816119 RepID=A0ABS5CTT2_9FLAO|nr:hypothetical protein [Flavobacterium flabelliforme]MBP4142017.1 hypothetical protein [Flavobacterium flabelliforme]
MDLLKKRIEYKVGQKVKLQLRDQVMEIIGFEPAFIENVITQWENEDGSIATGKFMELELEPVK